MRSPRGTSRRGRRERRPVYGLRFAAPLRAPYRRGRRRGRRPPPPGRGEVSAVQARGGRRRQDRRPAPRSDRAGEGQGRGVHRRAEHQAPAVTAAALRRQRAGRSANTGKPGAIARTCSSVAFSSMPSKNMPTSLFQRRRYSLITGGFSSSVSSTGSTTSTRRPSRSPPPPAPPPPAGPQLGPAGRAHVAHPLGVAARRHEVLPPLEVEQVDDGGAD